MILWIHCLCLLFYTDIIINKLINSSFKKKFPLTSSDVDPHWDYADPDPAFFSMRIQAKKVPVHVKNVPISFLIKVITDNGKNSVVIPDSELFPGPTSGIICVKN